MTDVVIKNAKKKRETIPMYQLKNGEAAVVVDNTYPEYDGHLVMRTLSSSSFEVMDLTDSRPDACWTSADEVLHTSNLKLRVRVIDKITIIIGGAE